MASLQVASGEWRFVVFILLFLLFVPFANAQEEDQLRITAVDFSAFPIVEVRLLTGDGVSAPLADLSALSLRENNIPLDFETSAAPIGVDATFVLDANAEFGKIDNTVDGRSRQEKVRDSILRYAEFFMRRDGLDRVSIIVADEDGENGRFLIQDAIAPQELSAAIEAYQAAEIEAVPLQGMMELALGQVGSRSDDGRFQAVVLFSDAGELDAQLDTPALTALANGLTAPLYTVILGDHADAVELANAAALSDSTRAAVVHMPVGGATDEIYRILQGQGEQTLLSYQSPQQKSGRYPISLNLGTARAAAAYELALQTPIVAIESEAAIVRVGDKYNTLLADLQPAVYEVAAAVGWPDGMPRQIESAILYADGEEAVALHQLSIAKRLVFEWDIAERNIETVELRVELTDELGMMAVSEPQTAAITIERPILTLPTPVPTIPAPVADVESNDTAVSLLALWAFLAALVVVVLILVRRHRSSPKEDAPTETPSPPAPLPPVSDLPHTAVLEWQNPPPDAPHRLPLPGDNVTIGRDGGAAQLAVADPTVSRLHARIRKRDGRYWLSDEGSASGTFRNYERLGLAPRHLQNGDLIGIGKVTLVFRLVGGLT